MPCLPPLGAPLHLMNSVGRPQRCPPCLHGQCQYRAARPDYQHEYLACLRCSRSLQLAQAAPVPPLRAGPPPRHLRSQLCSLSFVCQTCCSLNTLNLSWCSSLPHVKHLGEQKKKPPPARTYRQAAIDCGIAETAGPAGGWQCPLPASSALFCGSCGTRCRGTGGFPHGQL